MGRFILVSIPELHQGLLGAQYQKSSTPVTWEPTPAQMKGRSLCWTSSAPWKGDWTRQSLGLKF